VIPFVELIGYIEKFNILFQLMRKLLKMLTRDEILNCRQLTHTANEVGCRIPNHLRPKEYTYHLSSSAELESIVRLAKSRVTGLPFLRYPAFALCLKEIPLPAITDFAQVLGPEVKKYSFRLYKDGTPDPSCLTKISTLLTASTQLRKLELWRDFDLSQEDAASLPSPPLYVSTSTSIGDQNCEYVGSR